MLSSTDLVSLIMYFCVLNFPDKEETGRRETVEKKRKVKTINGQRKGRNESKRMG
jgi:hypothetical protein